MIARAIVTVLAALCASEPIQAPAPTAPRVAQCTEGMRPIADGRLERAVESLGARHPDLAFSTESACAQARETARALRRTLRRDHLKGAVGYEFVMVVRGESYFTMERFRMPKASDLRELESALQRCGPHCKLSIEENTCLRYFVSDRDVLLMISSATGCRANTELFEEARAYFLPERGVGRDP